MAEVLYISYDGLADPLGQSQIVPYLVRLAREGHSITIVSFEKRTRYNSSAAAIRSQLNQATIGWRPLIYHKWPPVVSTLWDLYLLRKAIRRLHFEKDFQIVHCRSYIAAFAGVWMKLKFGTKFIFDMRGFWADERVEGNIWSKSSFLYARIYDYFKRKEKQFLQIADAIVTLTENAAQEINSWRLGTLPIYVIPTCVDLDLFDPSRISDSERASLRSKLGFGPHDFILLYLGSWGTWYQTKEMMAFFRQLRQQQESARFLIVTPDNVDDHADAKVVSARREEVPSLIGIADLAVFFIRPGYSKKASSATKLGEILAMGVPVVTNAGWGDIELYHQLLPHSIYLRTSFSISSLRYEPEAAREFCHQHLSLDTGVNRYAEIYRHLSEIRR